MSQDPQNPWTPRDNDQSATPADEAYGQQSSGQGSYGQGSYDQGSYDQGSYGQDAYGQSAQQQGGYGQDPYGQDPYGQPGYGQPQAAYPVAAMPVPGDPGTLDLPWYGIGFTAAIKRAFSKAFVFDGRASRGEYWWVILAQFLLSVIMLILGYALLLSDSAVRTSEGSPGPVGIAGIVVLIAWLVVSVIISLLLIPLTIRRLHDANFSGWFWLLNLITSLIVMILCALPSNPMGARFDKSATNR